MLSNSCCRFTVELPPGLLQRNAELGELEVPPSVQTREQIEAIVKEARIMQTMVRDLVHIYGWATRHLPHHNRHACTLYTMSGCIPLSRASLSGLSLRCMPGWTYALVTELDSHGALY